MFSPEEVEKLLAGLPRGGRLGDLFRLLLLAGCRVDEAARLPTDIVEGLAPMGCARSRSRARSRRSLRVPFAFTGGFGLVTLDLDRPALGEADTARLAEAMRKQQVRE